MEIRIVREDMAPGLDAVEFNGDTLYVESPPLLSDADFQSVVAIVGSGELHIEFQLHPTAGERFTAATSALVGTALAVVVDSIVRSAPVIQDRLGRRGRISFPVSDEEADHIADLVRTRWPPAVNGV